MDVYQLSPPCTLVWLPMIHGASCVNEVWPVLVNKNRRRGNLVHQCEGPLNFFSFVLSLSWPLLLTEKSTIVSTSCLSMLSCCCSQELQLLAAHMQFSQ
jgi:hypothetical protein